MQTPNEFWLQVHKLLEAYDAEGLTPDERASNITDELLRSPPVVQEHVLAELAQLVACLPELYPLVLAAVSAQQHEELALSSARLERETARAGS